MNSCDIGKVLKSECHKTSYSRSKEIFLLLDLDTDTRQNILWRSELRFCEELFSICNHHFHYFGKRFEKRNGNCCNVYKVHKNKIKGNLISNI